MTSSSTGDISVPTGTQPSSTSESATQRYIHSDIWERLVESGDDLPGIVAYGVYQLRKKEWIAFYETTHKCLPSEEQVKDFSASQRDASIKALKMKRMGFSFGLRQNTQRVSCLSCRAKPSIPKLQIKSPNLMESLEKLRNNSTTVQAYFIIFGLTWPALYSLHS